MITLKANTNFMQFFFKLNAVTQQGNAAAHHFVSYSALSGRFIVVLIASVKSYHLKILLLVLVRFRAVCFPKSAFSRSVFSRQPLGCLEIADLGERKKKGRRTFSVIFCYPFVKPI